MGRKPRLPSCTECGACCVAPSDQEVFCDVTEEDIKRLPRSARHKVKRLDDIHAHVAAAFFGHAESPALATKTVTIKRGPLRTFPATVCSCLAGDVMHKVRCTIYEDRPSICRTAVKPGDRACREIRRAFRQFVEEP